MRGLARQKASEQDSLINKMCAQTARPQSRVKEKLVDFDVLVITGSKSFVAKSEPALRKYLV